MGRDLLVKFICLGSFWLPTQIHASQLPFDSFNYTLFESGHVRPMAISDDGTKLFVVNTPDNHLEIYDIQSGFLITCWFM